MPTLQPLSDLHLEFYKSHPPTVEVVGDYVALCGDIGRPRMDSYRTLLNDISSQCKGVLVVLGNHEYWSANHIHSTTVDAARKVCSEFSNVYFLHNSSVTLEGIRFLGCPLWTHIPDDAYSFAKDSMNDYWCIRFFNGQRTLPISPHMTSAWHKESVDFLERELSTSSEPTVVLTHHLPVETTDKHPCYGTDLRERLLYPYPHLKLWVHGHNHQFRDEMVGKSGGGGVRLVSNAFGYKGETTGYDPHFVVSLNNEF